MLMKRLIKLIYWRCITILFFVLHPKRFFEKTCIVMVDGGMASQMRQYLLGCAVAKASGIKVKYDLSWFERCGMDILGQESRSYVLEKIFPSAHVERAGKLETYVYRNVFWTSLADPNVYDPNVLISKKNRYLGGYYRNKQYIYNVRDIEREIFTFNVSLCDENTALLDKILSEKNSVAVHMRRGDFIGSVHDCTNEKYFQQAMDLLSAKTINPLFFIFSNDIDWAKKTFAHRKVVYFLEANDIDQGYFDMYLMSRCKHFIISNSWFGVWAARLGADSEKIVICPHTFFRDDPEGEHLYDIVDEDWINIKCDLSK